MKCLEAVDKMPRATKEQDWTDEVNAMTNTMTKHAVPFETTTRGQLHDLLDGFLQDCSTDEEKNSDLSHCLSGGWVHIDAKNYYFRMKDFMSYLKTQSTVIFKNNYVAGILRMDFNAESERTDSVRYLSITKEKITNRPTSLKPQEIEDNDPF